MSEIIEAPEARALSPQGPEPGEGAGVGGPQDLANLAKKAKELSRVLASLFPGREREAEAIVVGLATGLPVFMMSPPGTAKTAMVDTLAKLTSAKYFYILLTKYTEPDEILGPIDIRALREGEYRRITKGRLPEAEIAFLDEVFKASSAIRNILLDVILNKRIVNGDKIVKIPMKALYTASNELPQDEEDAAFYDRLTIRVFFGYVSDDLLETLIERGVVYTVSEAKVKKPVMTMGEVDTLQRVVRGHALWLAKNEEYRKKAAAVVAALRAEGIEFSDRRAVQTMIVAAGVAYARGRTKARLVDLADAFLYTAPEAPEQFEVVEKVLADTGLYAEAQTIEEIRQLIAEAESLLEQFRRDNNVTTLRAAGAVVKRLKEKVKEVDALPENLRRKIEAVAGAYKKALEELIIDG